jgi:hypothetical protein
MRNPWQSANAAAHRDCGADTTGGGDVTDPCTPHAAYILRRILALRVMTIWDRTP